MSKYFEILGSQGYDCRKRNDKYRMGEGKEEPCNVGFELEVSV